MGVLRYLFNLLWVANSVVAFGAPGDLDPTFGNAGFVVTEVGWVYTAANGIVLQPDGKILVGGTTRPPSSSYEDYLVLRYNSDGSLDTSFNGTGYVTTDLGGGLGDYGTAIALQTDGKIVTAGYTKNGSFFDLGLVRYNSTGALDTTFGTGGIVRTGLGDPDGIPYGDRDDIAYCIAIQSDGKILVAGSAAINQQYSQHLAIVRYLENGELDPAFGNGGVVATEFPGKSAKARDIALGSDGAIYVSGGVDLSNFVVAKYTSAGVLDLSFGGGGFVLGSFGGQESSAEGIELRNDGKIVVSGYTGRPGYLDVVVAQFTAEGFLDSDFGNTGLVTTSVGARSDAGYDLKLQSDGKIVVAGTVGFNSIPDTLILRYTEDGELDPGFGGVGYVTTSISPRTDVAFAVAIQPDGKIISAGFARDNNDNATFLSVARYEGGPFPPVVALSSTEGIGTTSATVSGSVHPNGRPTTGQIEYGTSTAYGAIIPITLSPDDGMEAQMVSAWLSGLAPGTTYFYRLSATNADGSDVAVGSFKTISTNANLANLTLSSGELVPAFNASQLSYATAVDYPVIAMTMTPTVEDAGASVTVQALPTSSGAPSPPIPLGVGPNSISIIVTAEDGVTTRTYLVSVARSPSGPGALDPFFGAGGIVTTHIGPVLNGSFVSDVVVQPDLKLVAVGYSRPSSTDELTVVRYDSDGELDATFGTMGIFTVPVGTTGSYGNAAAIQSDGKILVAGHSSKGITLVRLTPAGVLDSSFGGDGVVTASIDGSGSARDLVLLPDGRFVTSGSVLIGGVQHIFTARFLPDGALDNTFNGTGLMATNLTGFHNFAGGHAVQRDGKILVVGQIRIGASSSTQVAVAMRHNEDGSLDPSFGGSGYVTFSLGSAFESVTAVTVQPDGRIVIGGNFAGPINNDIWVGRLQSTGAFDGDFGIGGLVRTDINGESDGLNDLVLQGNGRILVTGFANNGSSSDFLLCRYESSGQLDSGFGVGGIVTTDIQSRSQSTKAIVLMPDGGIVVGGSSQINGTPYELALLKYVGDSVNVGVLVSGAGLEIADGDNEPSALDHTDFGYLPLNATAQRTFSVENTGTGILELYPPTIRIVGPDASDFAVAHYPPSTLSAGESATFSLAFSPGGAGNRAATVQIVSNDTVTGLYEFAIGGLGPSDNAQLESLTLTQGSLVPSFSSAVSTYSASVPYGVDEIGIMPVSEESSALVRINGVEVISGSTLRFPLSQGQNTMTVDVIAQDGLTTRTYTAVVTRESPTTGYPDSLDAIVGGGNVYSVVEQVDGKIVLAGGFTSILGTVRHRIARLNADGTLDASFDPRANNTVNCIEVLDDGSLIVGGLFESFQPHGVGLPEPRGRLARILPDGNIDGSFAPECDAPVFGSVTQPDGRILIAGSFGSVRGAGASTSILRGGIARLLPDGTLDMNYDPNTNGSVFSLAIQRDGRVVLGGDFTRLSPNAAGTTFVRNRVARLEADGTVDPSFDPNVDGAVRCLSVQSNGNLLLGGDFRSLKPYGSPVAISRSRIARILPGGGVDTGFDVGANSQVSSMAIQADGGILLGGYFTGLTSKDGALVSRRYVARVHSNGDIDESFDPSASSVVWSTSLQADGRPLIGGTFVNLRPNLGEMTISRLKFARLFNAPAQSVVTVLGAGGVRWVLGGTAPQLNRVVFETSIDSGASWAFLGEPDAVAGTSDWELSGVALSGSGLIRARGRSTGGFYNGSSGLLEQIVAFSVTNPDLDADGLPDSWERTHFGSTVGHDAFGNFDGDPYCELLELAFGLNPTRSDSGGIPEILLDGDYLTVSINKQAGVLYEVQSAGTLQDGAPDSFSKNSTTVLIDSGSLLKVRDNVPRSSGAARFMRVKVIARP